MSTVELSENMEIANRVSRELADALKQIDALKYAIETHNRFHPVGSPGHLYFHQERVT